MGREKRCAICWKELTKESFALSDLQEPPKRIQVCEACAAGGEIHLTLDGIGLEVDRDEFLQCDRDELEMAMGEAFSALDDAGWILESLSVRKRGG